LAACVGQGINEVAANVLQAELESLKQAHRACTHDDGIGVNRFCRDRVCRHGAGRWLALEFSEFADFVFPYVSVWQWGLALGDAGPADGRQLSVEFCHVFLAFRHIFFGVDGVHGALRNADRAVDALVWIDGEKVGAFAEAVDRANVHTVGVLTLDTGFGDYVRHDNSINV
jgi:hypothetical protein